MQTKNILVPLAKGFEEIEFIGIADVLRRAGANVLIASLDDNKLVTGANGIKIQADTTLKDIQVDSLCAIALAGGYEGMQNLANSSTIISIIKELHNSGKIVSAICASPIVLNKAGVISGDFTCYPGCEEGIQGKRLNQAVVKNKNVITSAGPGTAVLFGLELVREIFGEESYKQLYNGLQMNLV